MSFKIIEKLPTPLYFRIVTCMIYYHLVYFKCHLIIIHNHHHLHFMLLNDETAKERLISRSCIASSPNVIE